MDRRTAVEAFNQFTDLVTDEEDRPLFALVTLHGQAEMRARSYEVRLWSSQPLSPDAMNRVMTIAKDAGASLEIKSDALVIA